MPKKAKFIVTKHDRGQTICFGSDWLFTMSPSKANGAPENTSVSDLLMTVSPVAEADFRSVSTVLLNGIVELARSGRRGVPFDLDLAAWSYANKVVVHVFSQNGMPRLRLSDQLAIRFAVPEAASLDPDQTRPARRKRRRIAF